VSEILKEDFASLSQDEVKRYTDILFSAANQGHGILENLLTYSRELTKKISFTPKSIELAKICNLAVNDLQQQIATKAINLSFNQFDKTLVLCDFEMIRVVFRNIIANSIKFSFRGGEIKIVFSETDKFIFVSITDLGVGMSPETIQGLFNFNNQFSKKGTEGEMGHGLGLMITREFVEKNGGRIWVESAISEGSTFFFTLPKGTEV
jgi:signal transduction histidine kinase